MSFEDDLAQALIGAEIAPGTGPTAPNNGPGAPPSPSATITVTPRDVSSGKAVVATVMRAAGLEMTPELAQYAQDLATGTANDNDLQNRLMADVYDAGSVPGKLVAAKYPAIFARQKAGLPPLTVGGYISLSETFHQTLDYNGVTPYVDSTALVDKWIAGDTSPKEANDRLAAVRQVVLEEPADVRAETQRLFGAGDALGAQIAYYLDPAKAVGDIQHQMRAAEVGAASKRAGYGPLSFDEVTRLEQQGVTAGQASPVFGQLGQTAPLFAPLPGSGEDQIGREDQLNAAFNNDAAAKRRIANRQRARQAQFEGGGGFQAGKAGVTGLGSATGGA